MAAPAAVVKQVLERRAVAWTVLDKGIRAARVSTAVPLAVVDVRGMVESLGTVEDAEVVAEERDIAAATAAAVLEASRVRRRCTLVHTDARSVLACTGPLHACRRRSQAFGSQLQYLRSHRVLAEKAEMAVAVAV